MKVSELEGPMLAVWVARAQGFTVLREGEGLVVDLPFAPWVASFAETGYRPDLNWNHGGPLLDEFNVMILGREITYERIPVEHSDPLEFRAGPARKTVTVRVFGYKPDYKGKDTLEAACRAIVGSVYGEEVPDD